MAGHEGGIEKAWTEFNQYLTLLNLFDDVHPALPLSALDLIEALV